MGNEHDFKHFKAVFVDDKILIKTGIQAFSITAVRNKKHLELVKYQIASGKIKCYDDLFSYMYNETKTTKLMNMTAVKESWYV